MLAANPGWSPESELIEAQYADEQRENFFLGDRARDTPGARWYRDRLLKDVLRDTSEDVGARRLAVVDLHAYHSKNWTALPVTVPTQQLMSVGFVPASTSVFVAVLRAHAHW